MQSLFKKALQSTSTKCLLSNQFTQSSLMAAQFRLFNTKVFVEGLPQPQGWTEEKLNNRFSSVGNIEQVKLFKNSEGSLTGKGLIVFEQDADAEKAISKFNGVEVDGVTHNAREFVPKTPESGSFGGAGGSGGFTRPAQDPAQLARRVYVTNVPYGAVSGDIQEIAQEVADIESVSIPKDR
jgi:hypothetical protein